MVGVSRDNYFVGSWQLKFISAGNQGEARRRWLTSHDLFSEDVNHGDTSILFGQLPKDVTIAYVDAYCVISYTKPGDSCDVTELLFGCAFDGA